MTLAATNQRRWVPGSPGPYGKPIFEDSIWTPGEAGPYNWPNIPSRNFTPAPSLVMPELEDPIPMPLLSDAESRAARRRSVSRQRKRRGRASTILTEGDTLGP